MNFKKYFLIIITGIFHSAVYFSFGNSTIYPADSQSVIPTHLNGSQRVGPADSNNGQIVRLTHSDMPSEIITTEQPQQHSNEPDSQSVISTHVNGSQRVVPGDSNNGQIVRLTHSDMPAEMITITSAELRWLEQRRLQERCRQERLRKEREFAALSKEMQDNILKQIEREAYELNAESERKLRQFAEQHSPHYYLPPKRKIEECPACVIGSSVLCCWWPCLLYWGMEPSEK